MQQCPAGHTVDVPDAAHCPYCGAPLQKLQDTQGLPFLPPIPAQETPDARKSTGDGSGLLAGCGVMLVLAAIVVVTFLNSLTGSSQRSSSPTPRRIPTTSSADGGAEVRLHFGGSSGQSYLAVDKATHDELIDAILDEDALGWTALLGSGRVFQVPDGTKVKLLERSLSLAKVRVLEGPQTGKVGWVVHEAVD